MLYPSISNQYCASTVTPVPPNITSQCWHSTGAVNPASTGNPTGCTEPALCRSCISTRVDIKNMWEGTFTMDLLLSSTSFYSTEHCICDATYLVFRENRRSVFSTYIYVWLVKSVFSVIKIIVEVIFVMLSRYKLDMSSNLLSWNIRSHKSSRSRCPTHQQAWPGLAAKKGDAAGSI